jgi:hypothetical protein
MRHPYFIFPLGHFERSTAETVGPSFFPPLLWKFYSFHPYIPLATAVQGRESVERLVISATKVASWSKSAWKTGLPTADTSAKREPDKQST